MIEEVPAKRKRGRPRNVAVEEVPRSKTPIRGRNLECGKHRFSSGDIAGYNTAEVNYQFKVVRCVAVSEHPTWIWGSTQGNSTIDMIVREDECVLLSQWV